ncbi:hypothetical protein [Nannocystis pusilla]|uniref:hypothetical protein n=1 Tax=Nannocystis pusilla TaxID=889268 RepID=UPI003B760EBA
MRPFFLYAGIALVAGSTLALEILLTRITSVIAWYHLSFFVIALAMLGMTAGSIYVFMRPGRFGQAVVVRRLARSSALFAALAPLAVAWTMSGPLLPVTDLMGFFALLGFGAALAVPFAAAGVALTLALTRTGLPPGRAYGCDLLGAAAGCGLVIPLLDAVDAASAVLVVGAVAALGALAFATCDEEPGERRRSSGHVLRWRWRCWRSPASTRPPRRRRCARRGSRACARTRASSCTWPGTRTRG